MLSALATASALPGGVAAQSATSQLEYDILHDHAVIGHEHMTFRQDGDKLLVHTEVAMKVNLLFITAFRYEQTRDEVWRNDKISSYTAVTNDNGTPYDVRGEARPDGIRVTSGKDSWLLPADSVPLTFWHVSSVVGKGALFDVETGKLLGAAPTKLGDENVSLGGKIVPATHYKIKSDRTDDLWYDASGRLVKAVVVDKNGEAEWIAK